MERVPYYKSVGFVDDQGQRHELQLKCHVWGGHGTFVELYQPLMILTGWKQLRIKPLLEDRCRAWLEAEGGLQGENVRASSVASTRLQLSEEASRLPVTSEYMCRLSSFLRLVLWWCHNKPLEKMRARGAAFLEGLFECIVPVNLCFPSQLDVPSEILRMCGQTMELCSHLHEALQQHLAASVATHITPQKASAWLLLSLTGQSTICRSCSDFLHVLSARMIDGLIIDIPLSWEGDPKVAACQQPKQTPKRRRLDEDLRMQTLVDKKGRRGADYQVADSTEYAWLQTFVVRYLEHGLAANKDVQSIGIAMDASRIGGEETVVYLLWNGTTARSIPPQVPAANAHVG